MNRFLLAITSFTLVIAASTNSVFLAMGKEKETVSDTNNYSQAQSQLTNASLIMEKVLEADKKNHTVQAFFTNYSKGNYHKGKKTAEIIETKISGKITFSKRPLRIHIKVIESPEFLARGSSLLYTGGAKVKVRADGILGLFPISFPLDSEAFSNSRNHNALSALEGLTRLKLPGTRLTFIGEKIIKGKSFYQVQVYCPQRPDNEITHEIYTIDPENYFVVINEMFVGKDMVGRYEMTEIRLNPKLKDTSFEL